MFANCSRCVAYFDNGLSQWEVACTREVQQAITATKVVV